MPHPVVHFEIGCRNSEKTQAFYRDLFGWGITPMGPAGMIDTGMPKTPEGMPSVGINGHINCLGHEPHNYLTVYVQSDDLEATLKKVEALGGSRLVPITEVPGMGWFAWFKDPEGTCIGLWKNMAR